MEETRINLNMLLPGLPGEQDECVNRIIKSLENKRGIDNPIAAPWVKGSPEKKKVPKENDMNASDLEKLLDELKKQKS